MRYASNFSATWFIRGIGFLWLLIGLANRPVRAAEVLRWMVEDNPPFFAVQEPWKGAGIGDQSMEILFQRLVSFENRIVPADTSRAFYEITHRDGICIFATTVPPEIADKVKISERSFMLPGYRFIIPADRYKDFAPMLTAAGEIDLGAISRGAPLHGAYLGATPSKSIADLIDRRNPGFRLEAAPEQGRLLGLLHAGRVDFLLAEGWTVIAYNFGFPADPRPMNMHIKGVPAFLERRIVCSDRALGRKAIAAIDMLESSDEFWRTLVSPYEPALSADDFSALLTSRH